MTILLKDAREAAVPEDGARVLVDWRRPWGVTEEALVLRSWHPELAPSPELQRWFVERPGHWMLFRRRYMAELSAEEAVQALNKLEALAAHAKRVTLLTSVEDPERSHAAILRDLLEGVKKPPSTSGPARAAASGRMSARRPR